jgi:AcrR family transcriptional regulator
MVAAEAVLANKTAKEITLHDVASAAGVDETMIHYYFGGKDGLMIALLEEVMRNAPYRHRDSITQDCIIHKSIEPLVQELADYYYPKISLVRMAVEMASSSPKFRTAYMNRYFDVSPKFVTDVVKSMADAGIYSKGFGIKFMSTSVCSLVWGPSIFTLSTELFNIHDELDRPQWIEGVSRLIDVAFKAPAAA